MNNIGHKIMNMQEKSPLNIYQKLIELRKTVLYMEKDTAGYNFKYATTAALFAEIRPVMDELGLLAIPSVESFEMITVRVKTGEIQVPKITVSYTWINADNPVEQIKTLWTYYEDKNTGSQGIGSLLTYAERYFFYKSLQIATDKDSPEEFYRKNEIENKAEILPVKQEKKSMPPAQPAPSTEKQVYTLSPDECKKWAPLVWRRLQEKDASLQASAPTALPYYLLYLSRKYSSVNWSKHFDEKCPDPLKFIAQMNSWFANLDSTVIEITQEFGDKVA